MAGKAQVPYLNQVQQQWSLQTQSEADDTHQCWLDFLQSCADHMQVGCGAQRLYWTWNTYPGNIKTFLGLNQLVNALWQGSCYWGTYNHNDWKLRKVAYEDVINKGTAIKCKRCKDTKDNKQSKQRSRKSSCWNCLKTHLRKTLTRILKGTKMFLSPKVL